MFFRFTQSGKIFTTKTKFVGLMKTDMSSALSTLNIVQTYNFSSAWVYESNKFIFFYKTRQQNKNKKTKLIVEYK